ncbi:MULTISPECIES: hypothetical protein [Exiguobacterium]|uniref:Uncharacterized protein n=1 Tax=Exiguobacterium sibiricum (strain DSM 17290 / CCUG 55495 / CIP 109462 / JCM 13490 / 255-15) TaxID=262543 RepID=B1YFP9_EXIS2|nr:MULTISPECIES: hypothetical protein [Exiguobacterium]ACB62374.1 hypothetical protein Exig_2928 [Exiguobacterium sibiricum 255-15]MCT4792883.1 hypothetical protein [Exiguobacterium artemiae]
MKPKPFAKWIVGLSSSVFLGLAIGQLTVATNDQPANTINTGDSYSNETTIPSQPSNGDDDEWGESDEDNGYYYEEDDDDDGNWQSNDSSGFNQPSGGSDGQSSHSK